MAFLGLFIFSNAIERVERRFGIEALPPVVRYQLPRALQGQFSALFEAQPFRPEVERRHRPVPLEQLLEPLSLLGRQPVHAVGEDQDPEALDRAFPPPPSHTHRPSMAREEGEEGDWEYEDDC